MRGDGFLSSCSWPGGVLSDFWMGVVFWSDFGGWRVSAASLLNCFEMNLSTWGEVRRVGRMWCAGKNRIWGWEVCVRTRDGLLSAAPLTVTGHTCFIFRTHSSHSTLCPILQRAMTLRWVLVAGASACKYLIGFQMSLCAYPHLGYPP